MTFRVRFAKYGVVKFIGHLDVMRYFQKVIRRSELPVKYSNGFNPHQLLNFAQPLGVGITSDGEYMEIEFEDEPMLKLAGVEEDGKLDIGNGLIIPVPDMKDAPKLEKVVFDGMSSETYEGFAIIGVSLLPPPKANVRIEKAMSLVTAADYMISVKDGYDIGFADEKAFTDAWRAFTGQEKVLIVKKTKKTETELDLKQHMLKTGGMVDGETVDISSADGQPDWDMKGIAHADRYENGLNVLLRLTTGSVTNIRPELVIEAFCDFAGKEYNENAFQVHRMETYMGDRKLIGMLGR